MRESAQAQRVRGNRGITPDVRRDIENNDSVQHKRPVYLSLDQFNGEKSPLAVDRAR